MTIARAGTSPPTMTRSSAWKALRTARARVSLPSGLRAIVQNRAIHDLGLFQTLFRRHDSTRYGKIKTQTVQHERVPAGGENKPRARLKENHFRPTFEWHNFEVVGFGPHSPGAFDPADARLSIDEFHHARDLCDDANLHRLRSAVDQIAPEYNERQVARGQGGVAWPCDFG